MATKTGAAHYEEAERQLALADAITPGIAANDALISRHVARAQVHATLAQAHAQAVFPANGLPPEGQYGYYAT